MRIIEPFYSLTTQGVPLNQALGVSMLQTIEANARISHRAEDSQTSASWQRFIKDVIIGHGDWSVCEHAYVTANIRTDRGITHELVRHRLFSFTQESTRFVNGSKKYPQGLEFIKPLGVVSASLFANDIWEDAMELTEDTYLQLLDDKVRPQDARSVLPNALAATISMTGNLRVWRWFFQARCSSETHPDMKRITIPMLESFKTNIPLLYDDIIPNEKQTISMAKVH